MPEERSEIAAGVDYRFLLEDREDTTQDQDRPHPVEAGSCCGERAQILHHLKSSQGAGWQAHADDATVVNDATVGDRHLSTHGNDAWILLDHSHQLLEGTIIED